MDDDKQKQYFLRKIKETNLGELNTPTLRAVWALVHRAKSPTQDNRGFCDKDGVQIKAGDVVGVMIEVNHDTYSGFSFATHTCKEEVLDGSTPRLMLYGANCYGEVSAMHPAHMMVLDGESNLREFSHYCYRLRREESQKQLEEKCKTNQLKAVQEARRIHPTRVSAKVQIETPPGVDAECFAHEAHHQKNKLLDR